VCGEATTVPPALAVPLVTLLFLPTRFDYLFCSSRSFLPAPPIRAARWLCTPPFACYHPACPALPGALLRATECTIDTPPLDVPLANPNSRLPFSLPSHPCQLPLAGTKAAIHTHLPCSSTNSPPPLLLAPTLLLDDPSFIPCPVPTPVLTADRALPPTLLERS